MKRHYKRQDKIENSSEKIEQKPFSYFTRRMTGNDFIAHFKYGTDDCEDESDGYKEFKGERNIDTELLTKMIDKLKDLYIEDGTENFVFQDIETLKSGKSYDRKSFKGIKGKEINKILEKHLLCIKTAGCTPGNNENEKWFLFDIDVGVEKSDERIIKKQSFQKLEIKRNLIAQGYTLDIINILKKYIPEKYIYCYRSGTKGYHVVIYLDKPYNRAKIQDFQKNIISISGLNKKEVEIFPYIQNKSTQGKTTKFPMGRNFKSNDYSYNFCCFVDTEYLRPIIKNEKYFLNIEKLDTDVLEEAINKVLEETKESNVLTEKIVYDDSLEDYTDTKVEGLSIEERKSIIDFLKGFKIIQLGERHNMIYDIVLRLKDKYHLSKDQSIQYILIWISWQNGRYGSSYSEAKKDAINQVNYVYSKNYQLGGLTSQTAYISKKDIEFCIEIRNQYGKIDRNELNAIKVLISLISQSKMRGENKFYISYSDIEKLIKVRRNYINPCLKRLEKLGKIKIVNRIDYGEGKRLANEYIVNINIENQNIEGSCYPVSYRKRQNINDILKFFYNESELKKMMSQRIYNNLIGKDSE